MSAASITRLRSASRAIAFSVARTLATTSKAARFPWWSSSAIAKRFGVTRLPSIHEDEMDSERINR